MPEEYQVFIEDGWNCEGREISIGACIRQCNIYKLTDLLFQRICPPQIDHPTTMAGTTPEAGLSITWSSFHPQTWTGAHGSIAPTQPFTFEPMEPLVRVTLSAGHSYTMPMLPTLHVSPFLTQVHNLSYSHSDVARTRSHSKVDFEDWLHIGSISKDFACKLKEHINHFLKDIQEFLSSTHKPHLHLKSLIQWLKTAIIKMPWLQTTLPLLYLMFGLTSQFYLEAHRCISYHQKYQLTLKSEVNLPVASNLIGVWVEDESICAKYHCMGSLVWFLCMSTQISATTDKSIKSIKSLEPCIYQLHPLRLADCFKDDGIMRDKLAILKEQMDIGNFLRVVDL